jgi:hypothetical protein
MVAFNWRHFSRTVRSASTHEVDHDRGCRVDRQRSISERDSIDSATRGPLRRFSADPFRIIFSVDGRNCVMRFHKVRDGESWLHDDLEGYQEAVAAYEVT